MNDKNGKPLKPGDEVTVRFKIASLSEHVDKNVVRGMPVVPAKDGEPKPVLQQFQFPAEACEAVKGAK